PSFGTRLSQWHFMRLTAVVVDLHPRRCLLDLVSPVLISPVSNAQCDWLAKSATALQRRYETNEAACKALRIPPHEFDSAHVSVEDEYLKQVPMISSPREEAWLETSHDMPSIFRYPDLRGN